MSNYNKNISNYFLSLNRYLKRIIAIITDVGICILCTWLAFVLRLEELILFQNLNFYPAIISIMISIPLFWFFGLYRTIFRYTGLSIIFTILASISIYTLLFFLVIGVYGIQGVPRSVGIIQPVLLFVFVLISRLGVKYLLDLDYSYKINPNKKNVLIYGAGDAGRQLVIALENNPEFEVIGFIDDNSYIHKQVLLGKKIYSLSNLETLCKRKEINLIFLAMPSISRSRRNKIIKKLNEYKIIVKTLPTISEIVDDRIKISDIKDLNIDDLLSREEVEPDLKLLNQNIKYKTVLVTGAGGSIGSELCRQISKLRPNKLLLVEMNEFSLYKIYEEIKSYNQNLKLVPLLINVQDQSKLELIFETFNVDTVYHAAAYKHVPLVEENICEGVKNNVFGTLAITKASIKKNILNLVFVSSDKAVRPTNVMGASKRLAEICMQCIYEKNKSKNINFSIVRFGNVLESSGSVIPKFKEQIRLGGPVTLTHEDVTRYFMTTTEAAQLVIQAGAMGKHCEVFVLDMGESVKIKDLINKMINLSGFKVKDKNNPEGDIEIRVIGLRPGEKLYEELLIGDNPQKTNHAKIQKINEPLIDFDLLTEKLDELKFLLDKNNAETVKKLLNEEIKLYKSNSEIVDLVHVEQILSNKYQKNLSFENNKDKKVVKIK